MSRCHGSKISGSQHNCVPANMAGVTKKIDMYDFPLHDCTATQESNKTVTKQDTGTTQQQKMTRQAIVGHMCLQSSGGSREGGPPL